MRQLKIKQQITHRDEKMVTIYFQEVNKYDMVSAEEEAELADRIQSGDEHALNRLVEANLRFVISVAKQYQNQNLSFSDLINEGNLGLVKAAKKFDHTRGFKFISYAVWWIRQSIMQAISETRVVRLPVNRLSTINKVSSATPYLEQKYEREPTNGELADYLNINENLIEENQKLRNRTQSLDKPFGANGDNGFCLYDVIETDNNPAPDSELIADSLKRNLVPALNKLSYRESEIIKLSFGLFNNKEHSLSELANQFDLTSERIRQIKSSGLLKLKKAMAGKHTFFDNA